MTSATPTGAGSPVSPSGPSPCRTSRHHPSGWVGYDGDAGHGCGHHLHLSWEHAAAPQFEIAEWVEVFPVGKQPARKPRKRPKTPPAPPPGPSGGVSTVHAGGLSAGGD